MRNTIYESKDYKIKLLKEQTDLEALQDLCLKCSDYYDLHGIGEIGPETASDLFKELPPGKADEDKFILGLFKQENLIGIIEGVRDYPREGTWFIGQMMVDSQRRGGGLGASFFDEFQGWARDQKAQTLRLAVLEENQKAERFWQRRGFEYMEKKDNRPVGRIKATLKVYEKQLKP